MNDWKKFDEWWKRGKNFLVTVVHTKNTEEENKWFVYFYVYPEHPLFEKLTKESIYSPGLEKVYLHGGCTFSSWYCSTGGTIESKKYGCDYLHLGDERYEAMECAEDAHGIFTDAEFLHENLQQMM